MREKSSKRSWRSKALLIIDRYERGLSSSLSVNSLAESCSVSRTTVWRDAVISQRLAKAKSIRARSSLKDASQLSASAGMAERLRLRIQAAERDNFRLIETIAEIYFHLQEVGIDPSSVIKTTKGSAQLETLLKFLDHYCSQGASH